MYWLPLWGAEQRALKQVYLNQLHWEKTPHHGRNAETAEDAEPEPAYTRKEVLIGLLVLFVGLFIAFGLPLLFA